MRNYCKYPKIQYHERGPLRGTLYEKIDGHNCQIRNLDSRIIPGTRSRRIEEYILTFSWMKRFHLMIINNDSLTNLLENQILYCEFYENEIPEIYFIDLFDTKSEKFIEYEEAKVYLEEKGVKGIKHLQPVDDKNTHTTREIELLLRRGYNRNPHFEGFVAKDYEKQEFSKVVAEQIEDIFTDIIGEESLANAISLRLSERDIIEFLVKKASEKGRNLHTEVIRKFLSRI